MLHYPDNMPNDGASVGHNYCWPYRCCDRWLSLFASCQTIPRIAI